jgi:dihydrofolate synthase/folylpolyglutamate synthase
MEVGLGGRLDATNVCDRPLVSVITSISRDHWQHLGPTLKDIAVEKAGILKANCPAVIGSLPPEALEVFQFRTGLLNCQTTWVKPATWIKPGLARYQQWNYPLGLQGDFQLMNSAVAIAALETLRNEGWPIADEAIVTGLAQASWLGRLQWSHWQHRTLLLDGAHNAAAAQALRHYVDQVLTREPDSTVSWIIGMLSTKDHKEIFKALLRPGDRLYLVPIADHSTADIHQLAILASELCPNLAWVHPFENLELALSAAVQNTGLRVLCGSLYLIGHLLNLQRN